MSEINDFSKKLIEKIKHDHLTPKARWRFLLKNSLIWALGIFSLLLGGGAASLIYFISRNEDGVAFRRAGGGLIESLFLVLPIFWIICLILFVSLIYYYIKHTRNGYKYSNWQIILIIAALILFLSAMLSVSKLSAKIEYLVSQKTPYYDVVVNPGLNFWSQPTEGRLTGVITAKLADNKYLLVDKAKEEWLISETSELKEEGIELGSFVRLIGEVTAEHEFKTKEILPMSSGRGFLKRPPFMTPSSPPGCRFDKQNPCPNHQIRENNEKEENKTINLINKENLSTRVN